MPVFSRLYSEYDTSIPHTAYRIPFTAMSRFLVAIADFITNPDLEQKILGDIADVVALNGFSETEVIDRLENAHAIAVWHNLSLTKPSIERLKCCKLIVRSGVGIDNVDYKFARTRGIPMCNIPDYGTEDVADSAIGMALSLTRGINRQNSQLRAGLGEWLYTQAVPLQRLRGRVFAIVGLGRIGTAVALRLKALGMDVVFYDPFLPDGDDKSLGIRRAESLEELLRQAYIVSLHTPLTDLSRHCINANRSPGFRRAATWSTPRTAPSSIPQSFPTPLPAASLPALHSTSCRTNHRPTTIRSSAPGAIPIILLIIGSSSMPTLRSTPNKASSTCVPKVPLPSAVRSPVNQLQRRQLMLARCLNRADCRLPIIASAPRRD